MSPANQVPARSHLLEEMVWRLEVCTPLHAGSGEKLLMGHDFISRDGWAHVLDVSRALETLGAHERERLAQRDGRRDGPRLGQLVPPERISEVRTYAVRGPVSGDNAELRQFTRDAFGRPYLPGSTLKGALRTALLMRIVETRPDVAAALRAGATPHSDQEEPSATRAEQLALRIDASTQATDDVLRHLHVPDVWIPPARIRIFPVQIASMGDPEGSSWGWKVRGRNALNADSAAGEAVLRMYVEAIEPGTVLRVPLRIDRQRLRPDWLPGHPQRDRVQDFSHWEDLLVRKLLTAVRLQGERILMPERALWARSRPLPEPESELRALVARLESDPNEALLPTGWGIGWRGMTGAALERLDGELERLSDAGAQTPPSLREALAHRKFPAKRSSDYKVFPKSRRLAIDARDDRTSLPRFPMGWIAVRRWTGADTATPMKSPAGSGDVPPLIDASASLRQPREPVPPPTKSPARSASTAAAPHGSRGQMVQCRLKEQNRKGKWRVEVVGRNVEGVLEPEGAPEDLTAGQEVTLVVHNPSVSQDWAFRWPR